jgi:hypothetical protein
VDSASIAAIATAAGLAIGGLLTWLTTRRASSGRIGTSEAGVLWDQAQAMRAELVAQRDKAIEQRDRLIESQASQIIPALAAITEALGLISGALARIESRQQ